MLVGGFGEVGILEFGQESSEPFDVREVGGLLSHHRRDEHFVQQGQLFDIIIVIVGICAIDGLESLGHKIVRYYITY